MTDPHFKPDPDEELGWFFKLIEKFMEDVFPELFGALLIFGMLWTGLLLCMEH